MNNATTWLAGIAVGLVGFLHATNAIAQSSSLWQGAKTATGTSPLTLQTASPTYVEPKPPHEIKIHDIISVRVDVMSRMTAKGELQRRKNSRYDARLKDWIVLDGLRALGPAPQGDGEPFGLDPRHVPRAGVLGDTVLLRPRCEIPDGGSRADPRSSGPRGRRGSCPPPCCTCRRAASAR